MRLFAALVLGVAAVAITASAATLQPGDPRTVAAKVLTLTNEARAHARRCGDRNYAPAPPLRMNDQLAQAAAQHAKDMAQHRSLDHRGSDGSTPAQRVDRTGYRWRSVGENIAEGQETPEEVVQDWVASPGHCANIMSADFVDMGLAFAVNTGGHTAVYWAQVFGKPR